MIKLFIFALFYILTASVYANTSNYIVIQNEYFPKPGKENEVYELRLHASMVLRKLGVPKGRVLKIMNIEHNRPYVIWECDYASNEEREKAVKLVSQSSEFKQVETKMGTLINQFERITWQATE